LNIATRYLVPKQRKANGLGENELVLGEDTILELIRHYTREAGVRGLEREIARICRKVVKDQSLAGSSEPVVVKPADLENYAGVRKYDYGKAEASDAIGQVNGLAWTQVGGELLTIEAVSMPGKGKVTMTGSLGDSMQESITAALTVVRSRCHSLGMEDKFQEHKDLHVHGPEGATPKDGPSAGIGMCTALVSVLTGIPVRKDVAMTGEITLRGQVL